MQLPPDLSQLGSEVIFENEVVCVWRMELDSGESCSWHRHEADYLIIYTCDSVLELAIANMPKERAQYEAGFVQYTPVDQEFPAHHLTNVAPTRHEQFIIELKRPVHGIPVGHNGRKRVIDDGGKTDNEY